MKLDIYVSCFVFVLFFEFSLSINLSVRSRIFLIIRSRKSQELNQGSRLKSIDPAQISVIE